ncbi:MAG TPA: TlyA family RNA methyltransferase [Alphaproteobacteria bacterium]|nr:TlyA family RNA methyltransferase [Alphaproteobacteria bacterium]
MNAKRLKRRLDQLLVERGLAQSRAKAQALVLAGNVFSGERRLDKAGVLIAEDAALELRGAEHPWVSRGALKLERALAEFKIDAADAVALDIGASTGGFTEVLLARGARRVYAVDVGRGQLAWKLRGDPRVVVLEGVNARYLSNNEVPEPVDLVVCDASFIGLATILPAPLALAKCGARLIALIKPQFEAGPKEVGKGGIVKDEAVRAEACEKIRRWLEEAMDWRVLGLVESPIKGAKGNVEYLIAAEKPG